MTGEQLVDAQAHARGSVRRLLQNRSEDEVEDVLQNAAVKAIKFDDQFEGRSQFTTYFTRIAINEALMLLRSRRRSLDFKDLDERDERGHLLWEPISDQPSPERRTLASDIWDTILRATQQMFPAQRQGAFALIRGDVVDTGAKKARRHMARLKLRLALRARGLHD